MPDINDIYCCKCGKFILTEQYGDAAAQDTWITKGKRTYKRSVLSYM